MSKHEEKRNGDNHVTERLCTARHQTIDEKINSIKKQVYIAAAVNALWITILELLLRLGVHP